MDFVQYEELIKGSFKNVNIFTSVETDPPPTPHGESVHHNILWFLNKGLMQHNIYCTTTNINLHSKPV